MTIATIRCRSHHTITSPDAIAYVHPAACRPRPPPRPPLPRPIRTPGSSTVRPLPSPLIRIAVARLCLDATEPGPARPKPVTPSLTAPLPPLACCRAPPRCYPAAARAPHRPSCRRARVPVSPLPPPASIAKLPCSASPPACRLGAPSLACLATFARSGAPPRPACLTAAGRTGPRRAAGLARGQRRACSTGRSWPCPCARNPVPVGPL
nr:vegetative cell wall protein gp1-like [Aegilops tauschii subsp. strangulata]